MAKPKLPSTGSAGSAAPPVALLTHTPSPGLYSRLERAVESLPPTVKVDGLRNRLQKYKEGVSGWELDPVMGAIEHDNINSEVAGNPRRDISRKELLDIVHRTSPAFNHRQVQLSSGPADFQWNNATDISGVHAMYHLGGPVGRPTQYRGAHYESASEGAGDNYRVQLLMQRTLPTQQHDLGRPVQWSGGHWKEFPNTIAHMRTRDVGDALRINEVQSDIRNQNIENLASKKEFYRDQFDPDLHGQPTWNPSQVPLYDHYPEVLLKYALLDASQSGKRAIEIPPFAAIGRYVGMRPEGIKHVYGGQVPNTLMRASRSLGGLTEGTPFIRAAANTEHLQEIVRKLNELQRSRNAHIATRESARQSVLRMAGLGDSKMDPALDAHSHFGKIAKSTDALTPQAARDLLFNLAFQRAVFDRMQALGPVPQSPMLRHAQRHKALVGAGPDVVERLMELEPRMPQIMRELEVAHDANARIRAANAQQKSLISDNMDSIQGFIEADQHGIHSIIPGASGAMPAPSRRLEISDALRKRIIEGGIGLSVVLPLLSQQEEQ